MANTMTIEEARSIVAEHANQDLSTVIEMQDDFVMSLAKGYLKALAAKPTKGTRGPSMEDKVQEALEALATPTSTTELFDYMMESGLAHEGQYESMRSALSTGKNRHNRPFHNAGNGVWQILDDETKKKMELLRQLESMDAAALAAMVAE